MKSSDTSKTHLNIPFKSNSEKYNIAWFKLAEFVSRGEKERALGLYKLLTLSLNDQALIYQLEGDILLAFEDKNAIEKYNKAATIYKQESRFIEAAAIYEHLILLKEEFQFFFNLLEIYKKINFLPKIKNTLKKLITFSNINEQIENSLKFLEELENLEDSKELVEYYEDIVFILIKKNQSKDQILGYCQKVINIYFESNDINLNKFINKLEISDLEIYQETLNFLNNKSK